MKKFFALLLALCLFVPSAVAEGAPLLYRVTDGEGHELYLFGTIHVGDETMPDLVHVVYDTLISCDLVAMEIDPIAQRTDARAVFKTMSTLYLRQGDDIANYLSEETVRMGYRLLEQPKSFLSRIAPVGWYSFVQEMIYGKAELDANNAADVYVAMMAYDAGIKIEALETYDKQMAVFENTSLELMDFMIGAMLADVDGFKEGILSLMKAWRAGDAAELSRLIAEEDEIPDSLRAAYDKYAKMIQTDRDDAFLADAVRLLKSGDTALIAIGAAHIFGETGLAARLGALGYTVEVVERYLSAASGESA